MELGYSKFSLPFLVFNLFQTVLLFSLTSFTFSNVNFYTLVICFEFYMKRTGDVNSQNFLTNLLHMTNIKLTKRWSGSELVFLTIETAFDVRTPHTCLLSASDT